MKRTILSMCLFASITGFAAEINDVAQVVSYNPITRQVQETRQECYDEQIQESSQPQQSSGSYVGPIIGGIAGGILGNQVGGGSGRTAATVGGAIVGTMVGSNMSNNSQQTQQTQTRTVQRCRPVTMMKDVPNGYDVTYRYNGKEGRTTTQFQPGQTIRVGISAQN